MPCVTCPRVARARSPCYPPAGACRTRSVWSGTAAVGHVIYELRRQADCVIIEFPPALEAAETLALAQHVDDVVLTGAVGTTSRHDLEVVKRRLDAVGAHLLGLVLIESGGGRRAKRRAKAKARRRRT